MSKRPDRVAPGSKPETSECRMRAARKGASGQAIGQRLPVEELHDQIAVADVVERADVRMRELRDCFRFALESHPQLRVVRELGGQHFDRDVPFEPCIARLEHLSHAAGADGRDDFIGPEPGAGSDRHVRVRRLYGQSAR